MKKLPLILACIFLLTQCKAFRGTANSQKEQVYTKPHLVVGIVVDQMRYTYLTRFWNRYGQDGFKRLVRGGFLLKNTHYNYIPTYTAPGHTCIYTGTSPRYNGIISNHWYDKKTGQYIYCVADDSVQPVGTTSKVGKMSPHRLLSTTLGDQNRIATQFRGKTIGIALKDRAAILPAGRGANAAYWFVGGKEGKFVTSSYYRDSLPQWVEDFNNSGKAQSYIKPWHTLYPLSSYTESGPDKNSFEGTFEGKKTATFPYDLKKISREKYGYGILKRVPFGDDLTTDFALAAIRGENLGQDTITDVLTISYSCTDYVGHRFGVNSKEIEDTYLRLDQSIARLLKGLDKMVGKGNYTVFLTADHGGVNVPAYLKSKGIAAGYFKTSILRRRIKDFVGKHYGTTGLISSITNHQLFFDYKALRSHHIKTSDFAQTLHHYLQNYPKIAQVYTRAMIEKGSFHDLIARRIKNGFNPKRSGDVMYVFEPGVISYSHTGSTHGSPYNYDTHVPLIFYGKGIHQGQTTTEAQTIDIAPTLSALLGIEAPNAATGKVLSEVID